MSENNPEAEDDLIWRGYAAKLKPLAKRHPKKPLTKPATSHFQNKSIKTEHIALAPALFSKSTRANPPLTIRFERRREKQLRAGDIQIDAKLDLHGMTQDIAYDALKKFIAKHQKLGHRHLLIITGKGGAKQEGVLRKNFTHWLESLCERKLILGLRPAAPKHGGDGAFYVLLRKSR